MTLRPETRQRILDAARQLGYRPNRHAQVIRRGKSGAIGMLYFGSYSQLYVARQEHLNRAILERGYHALTGATLTYPSGAQGAWESLLEARVEGVILTGPAEWLPAAVLDDIRRLSLPAVAVSGVRFPGIPQVRADVRQGIADLTRHLLGVGHRRLVLLTQQAGEIRDEARSWPVLERIAGFEQAVAERRRDAADGTLHAEVVYAEGPEYPLQPYRTGQEAMARLLARPGGRPGAVLCSNDQWAHGALTACAAAGLNVPRDIALTGFDDEAFGAYGAVPLTTVAQPTAAMAQRAVDLLFRLIRGETIPPQEQLVQLPCRVVVRRSCGAAAAAGEW